MIQPGTKFSIPSGSIVVVSGANGNIASHILDQLIKTGYIVRGTVRDIKKNTWLIEHFSNIYGPGKIELVQVPDMSTSGCFDDAVKGASGFIHTATPVMDNIDPNAVIPTVIQGTLNALQSAAKEPKMKRFVLTSSSGACTAPKPEKRFIIDSNTWNEEAITAAWAPPPYEGFGRLLDVYYASKTQGEKEAWKWVDDNSPNFVLNTVLPNANFGPVIDKRHQQYHSTLGWVHALWNGFEGEEGLQSQPPQYYINIVDDAIVHVAALLYEDVSNERLFAFAYPYNWNDMLAIFRKLYPTKKFIDDIPNLQRDLSIVTNGRAEDLLKRFAGHGWTNLEETIKSSVADY